MEVDGIMNIEKHLNGIYFSFQHEIHSQCSCGGVVVCGSVAGEWWSSGLRVWCQGRLSRQAEASM